MYFGFDRRCMRILVFLSKYNDYITLDMLAQQLAQSRRSTQYDIYKINNIFKTLGLQLIKSKPNKGVMLLEEHKKWFENFSNDEKNSIDYIFTQDERIAVIICENILSSNILKIEQMSDRLMVSRNTIINDIKIMRKTLEVYDINFKYVSKEGYKIEGKPLKILSVYMYQLSKLYPLISENIIPYLKDINIQQNLNRLLKISKILGVKVQQEKIEKVAIMMKFYDVSYEILELQDKEIKESRVYELVREYFPNNKESLNLYVSIFLLGMRAAKNIINTKSFIDECYRYASTLVKYFEQLIDMELESKEVLIYNLSKHLSSSIYRYKLGLFDIDWDINKNLENELKEIFELVKLVVNKFSLDIGYPINDTETMYLTIYFSAHMKRYNTEVKKVPVILVTNDIKSLRALTEKFKEDFPMFHVINSILVKDLEKNIDLSVVIISTQLLKYNGFYVYISENLTKVDKTKILELYLNYRRLKTENEGIKLFNNIKKYINKSYLDKVRQEIEKYFFAPIPNLLQLLEYRYVQYYDEFNNYKNAIAQGALPLLEDNCIDKSYIDSLIANVDIYGCYTYMGNNVYIAHAKSNQNVKHSSIAVIVMKRGVIFPDGHIVKLLIITASIDKSEHFAVLKEAVKICNDDQKVKCLLNCRNEKDIYYQIKQFAKGI